MKRFLLTIALLLVPTSVHAQALTDSIVAYWKMENTADSVGSSTLTANNGVAVAAGKILNGYDFEDGSTHYLSITDNAALSMGNIDFWVNCWIKQESEPANSCILCKGDAGGAGDYEYCLRLAGDDLRWEVSDMTTDDSTILMASDLEAGTWYMVSAWHDATANLLYLAVNNGTPSTTAHTAGSNDSTKPFTIGVRGAALLFDGMIDEVGIWKRIPTAQNLTDLYNSGAGLTHPFTLESSSPPQAVIGAVSPRKQLKFDPEPSWSLAP